MSWKTSINNIKQIIQTGSPREIIAYLWDYFKWHFIILCILITMAANLIYTNITAKDYVLQGMFLNVLAEQDVAANLKESFLKEYPIDFDSQDVFFDTSLYYTPSLDSSNASTSYDMIQIIVTKIVGGQTDFIVADAKTLSSLAYEGYYAELPDILTEAQYKKYEPYFLYYDRAYLEYLDTLNYDDTDISYPDPTKPELMEDPVPIMLNVSSSALLSGVYLDVSNTYAFAVIANSSHQENALNFANHLLS